MRILSLRFKNINSLAGEWKIDFTDPAYLSSGIFAITGPTGAGKSTILDAIALALYGKTPRLGKIAKNAGELMSRQTGECFSEVEFVSDKGQYRCTWSVKRAHKKPDGEPQSPKHEIVDAKTNVPLETKQAAVLGKVIEVTGLDYQQFTRSILLAQGDFATFLDAKADERAPILEKITGTEIYGLISIAVHERSGKEKAALDALKERAQNAGTISPEQAAALNEELAGHENGIREISERCRQQEEAAKWLDTITALEQEIAGLEEQARVLVDRRASAENDLVTLARARKARDLEGMYSSLQSLRKQQESEKQEKHACEGSLAGFSAAYNAACEALRLAQERRDKAAGEKQQEDLLIRQVRELDTRIGEIRARQNERTREKQKLENEIAELQKTIGFVQAQAASVKKELGDVTRYIGEHPRDENLIGSLSGIEKAAGQIHSTEQSIASRQEEIKKTEQTLADAEQVVLRRKAELDRTAVRADEALMESTRIQKEREEITGGRDSAALRSPVDEETERVHRLEELGNLLKRIREDEEAQKRLAEDLGSSRAAQKETEEHLAVLKKDAGRLADLIRISEENLINLVRIKKYEDDRLTLKDGEPCPLCGSDVHPWRTGMAPVPGDAEKKHAAFKKENEECLEEIRKSEAERARIDATIQSGGAAYREREDRVRKSRAELETGCRALGITLGPDPGSAITAAHEDCVARLNTARTILARAEEKDQELKKAEQAVTKEKDALSAFQRDYDKAVAFRDTQIAGRERLNAEIAASVQDLQRQQAALLSSVQEYDILVFSRPTMTKEILSSLTKRRDEYVKSLKCQQNLEKELGVCESDIDRDRSLLQDKTKNHVDLTSLLAGIEKELGGLVSQRAELYGEKDPSAEETRVAEQAHEAEAALAAAVEAGNLADKQKTSCEEQIRMLTGKIESRGPALFGQEQEFAAACKKGGFTSEEEFLSARISPDRLFALEKAEADLVREETETASGLRDRRKKRAAEQEKALTTQDRAVLAQAIESDKTQITGLQLGLGRIRVQLEQYDGQVRQQQALAEAITGQQKGYAKWERLHDLIGSADGKKFRVFAQGLTFENLVVQANKHLRKMSDRYVLVRDKSSPLDLDIVDNYQAGEIRTTKNLSGGERFLVSLSLALGLSGMASHNVRIDSLFLDEGFGTLDEDTLETALETLASLQREGKIIGIISHVPALKERIPVQIQVEPSGGGRSRIVGPGCEGRA